jgi:hypothetical protein
MVRMHYPQQNAPPPPIQSKPIGCLGITLIVIGVGCVGTLGFCAFVFNGVATKTPEQRRADEQARAEGEAAQADAAAQLEILREPWKIKTRKACGLKPDAPIYAATVREQAKMCRDLVEEGLKVPGSGDFPELPGETETKGLSSADGCRSSQDSYVDAKNAFGVKVRTRYRCTYDPTTGLARYTML